CARVRGVIIHYFDYW
nr:immunoglobulin heavy chain junction region [Macaca mulatta]MOW26782.1 immunoglobulin heavy chain junction region [Macaca mulatta]MOW27011.1 immunoglobulin heavy chain junction region [Macaca mulatta]